VPKRKYSDDQYLEVRRLVEDEGISKRRACKEVGIGYSAYVNWGGVILKRLDKTSVDNELTLPRFPDDDLTTEEILDHLSATFDKKQQYQESLRWFIINVKTDKPIGINWFGDPHLGSTGCNVPLLRRDINIVKTTLGLYAANIGDTVDNWGGRLLRLYSESNISRDRERRLATWFLKEANIPWVLWLLGNHDVMDGAFEAHLRAINANIIPLVDWRARFKLRFSNGFEIKVDAAHDFKGHSLWNELHSLDRVALHDEYAHLYIAGHRHLCGTKQRELPGGLMTTLVRTRGYKFIDQYHDRVQFPHHTYGASVVTVFDPTPRSACDIVHAFLNVEEGADFLTYKRKKYDS